mgnify:CR=1 FL=1
MKKAYPVILSQGEKYIVAYVPDFQINTQGTDVPEAIEMARDAIGVVGIDLEDDGEVLPDSTAISEIKSDSAADIITLVDVDFGEYRRKNAGRIAQFGGDAYGKIRQTGLDGADMARIPAGRREMVL